MSLTVRYAGNDQSTPSDSLYLQGLPSSVDESGLTLMFSSLGYNVVRSRLMADLRGSDVCAAMVQLSSADEAAAAIAGLNGRSRTELEPLLGASTGGAQQSVAPLVVKYAGSGSPSENLYVAGLPSPSVDPDALNELFTALGLTVVRSRVMPDSRGTGSSTAMVQLGSQEEAEQAISALDGQQAVLATPAPVEARGTPGAFHVRYAGSDPSAPSDNLYMSGMPPSVDEIGLTNFFASLGYTLVRSRIMADAKGTDGCTALVQLSSADEAAAVIAGLNGRSRAELEPLFGAPAGGEQQSVPPLVVRYAGSGIPSDNLHIENLPSPNVDQDTLNELFISLGLVVVRSRVMPDPRGTGSSTAMVQLGSQEQAEQAINALNGQLATLNPPVPAETGSMPDIGFHVRYTGDSCLVLGGVPLDELSVMEMFNTLGLMLLDIKITPSSDGSGNSSAMVKCTSEDDAMKGLQALNTKIGASSLTDTVQPQKPSGLLDGGKMPSAAKGVSLAAIAAGAKAGSSPRVMRPPMPMQAPRAEAPAPSGPRQLVVRYAGSNQQPSDNLYISNLPSPSADLDALHSLFTSLALSVIRSRVMPDTRNTGSSGAMVQLGSQDEAASAIQALNGQMVDIEAAAVPETARTPDLVQTYNMANAKGGKGGTSKINLFGHQKGKSPWNAKGWGKTSTWGNSMSQPNMNFLPNSNWQKTQTTPHWTPKDHIPGTLTVRYAGRDQTESDNLYILGLPSPAVTVDSLHGIFTLLGFTVVRSRVISDSKDKGISAAMVQLSSPAEATQAIAVLHGQPAPELDVDNTAGGAGGKGGANFVAGNKRPHPFAGTLFVKYQGEQNLPSDNLYIAGLPTDGVDQDAINEIFSSLGHTVVRSRVLPDTKNFGTCAAMVQVGSVEEAAAAIEALNGLSLPDALYGGGGGGGGGMDGNAKDGWGKGGWGGGGWCGQGQGKGFGGSKGAGKQFSMGWNNPGAIDGQDTKRIRLDQPMNVLGKGAKLDAGGGGVGDATAAGGGDQPLLVRYAGTPQMPSDNLYISGLPGPAVDLGELSRVFTSRGLTVVRSRVMPDTRWAGSSTAMVQVGSHEEAAQAIAVMNGQTWQSLLSSSPADLLTIADSTSPAAASASTGLAPAAVEAVPQGKLSVRYAGLEQTPSDNLYLAGFPSETMDVTRLHSLFSNMGINVVRSRLMPDTRGTGLSGAMVQVSSEAEAELAIASLHGRALDELEGNGQTFQSLLSTSELKQQMGLLPADADSPAAASGATAGGAPAAAAEAATPGKLLVRYAGREQAPSDNLYIAGLPSDETMDDTRLHSLFSNIGLNVIRSRLMPDTRGAGQAAAMVQLSSQEQAGIAIASMHGRALEEVEGPRAS